MIVVLKQNPEKARVTRLMNHLTDMGLQINYSEGKNTVILGLIGDTTHIDERDLLAYDVVEYVKPKISPQRYNYRSCRTKNRRGIFSCDGGTVFSRE